MDDVISTISSLYGDEFFDKLEENLQIKIPKTLKNVLTFNDVECAQVLSKVNEEFVRTMESFMRDKFSDVMITDGQPIRDYLGKFVLCPQQFCFSTGQKIMLDMMIEHCAKAIRISSVDTTTVSDNSTLLQQIDVENLVQNQNTAVSSQQAAESKKKMLNALFQLLFAWMKKQVYFAEVFPFAYLNLRLQ